MLLRTIQLGDQHSITRSFSHADLVCFATLVGDSNPIHVDEAAARAAGFPACICHGVLVGSLFSNLMGMHLPGPQSVYLQQSFNFLKPVFVGDEVTATVRVREFNRHKSLIWLDTTVTKRSNRPPPSSCDGGQQGGKEAVGEDAIVCIAGTALGMNKTVEFIGDSPWTFVRDASGGGPLRPRKSQ